MSTHWGWAESGIKNPTGILAQFLNIVLLLHNHLPHHGLSLTQFAISVNER